MTGPARDAATKHRREDDELDGLSSDGEFEKARDAAIDGLLDEDETASLDGDVTAPRAEKDGRLKLETGRRAMKTKPKETVSWMDLPRKGQLAVLTLARLSEPLVQTSLQSYMFYQLKWFDPRKPDSAIASQAGILSASFAAAQFLTAMMWGRLADSPRFGRKKVLLVGLCGTTISCLGFGFATSFWHALVFRSLGGALNGNVGVIRTLISEIVREKKYQSRAFLLMPMTFNIGVIIGPILGGILSDPAGSYPELCGNVQFFKDFPYAAPNLLSAFVLFCGWMAIWLGLEETLDSRRDRRDMGIELRKAVFSLIRRCFNRGPSPIAYTPLASRDTSTDVELSPVTPSSSSSSPSSPRSKRSRPTARYTQRLPFRRIFTRNVTFTLLSHSVMAFHVGTFQSLWFVFLSTPVYDPSLPSAPRQNLPFLFTGGIGLPPRSVGMAMAILGTFGITLQLFLYPSLSARLGTLRSWRIFLLFFPVTYFLVPYLSLVPSTDPPPHHKSGAAVWLSIAAVLFCQVVGRTFALPAQTILVNNCTPHPSVLGTLHGLAQSVSSLTRTVGPMLCGYLYGLGLKNGVVGAVWWGLSAVALCGSSVSLLVREGDGHEIWLEGDAIDEEEKEEEGAGNVKAMKGKA